MQINPRTFLPLLPAPMRGMADALLTRLEAVEKAVELLRQELARQQGK